MNKIKQLSVLLCLVLLGIGILLLGTWDMQRANAASQLDTWFQVDPPLPEPWAGTGTIQCPDDPEHFYLVGGLNAAWIDINIVRRYDVLNGTWEVLAPLPIVNRAASLACYQGRIYAAGGLNAEMGMLDTLYIYDIALDTWSTGANLPAANVGMALGVWDGKLYLAGGWSGIDPWVPLADVHVYDIATDIWTPNGRPDMPVASDFSGVIQAGLYLYIVGGSSGDYNNNLNTTQRYNMQDDVWEQGPLFNSRRALTGMAVTKGYLYAVGGDANGGDAFDATNVVERLDLTLWPGGAWMDISDPLPEPLMTASFCSEGKTGGEIWAVGGLDLFDNPTDSMYYRPSESCADFYFGDLPRESMELGNHPGDAAHYVLPVINNGTLTDTYDISVISTWVISTPITIGPIEPGETKLLRLDVKVPADALPGDFDTAVVTVTSQGDPSAADNAVLTTSVTDWQDIDMPIGDSFHNIAQCPDEPDVFYMIGGGEENLVPIDDLWRYDANSNSWDKLADLPITGWGGVAGCYLDKLYIGGGSWTDFEFGSFNLASNTWTWLHFTPRWFYGAATGVWDGKLYVAGGYDIDPFIPTNAVNIYDITSNTWMPGPAIPTPFMGGGYAQAGPFLYIVGGISGDWNNNLDTTLRLNMATETWETGPTFTSQRGANALAITTSHLYAIAGDENGGERMDPTGLVEVLDLSQWPDGEWTNLGQPLPWPLEGVAGACTEAVTGGEIWSVGGAYGSWHHPWYEYHNISDAYFLHTEPCVSYGVDLPEPWVGDKGEAGTTIEYWLIITNTGVVTDYYTLDVSTTWNIEAPLGGPGPIGPGESLPIAIAIDIPPDALPGDQGVTEITAASISNPAAFDTTTITTPVGLRDFDLQSIPPDSQQGHPGNVLTYTLQVSNIGDFKDIYDVEISATWETTAALNIGPLMPGEDGSLFVYVTIPQDAMGGDWDYALVTLSSQIKPLISHSVKLTSTAVWHRMLMPLAFRN